MPVSDKVKKLAPKLVTIALVIVAVGCAYLLYGRYTARPWTRDGQVRATAVLALRQIEHPRSGDLLQQLVNDRDPIIRQLAKSGARASK